MSRIQNYIEQLNNNYRKALSVFLTAGYPKKENFVSIALEILDAGADVLELGIPFSDPIADGPIIQHSSQVALENGVTLRDTLDFAGKIKAKSDKPAILMGYSNPLLAYGLEQFLNDAKNSGVDGLIIPDIPLEEYDQFWNCDLKEIEIILLTTPTSPDDRVKKIDKKSSGFVYCVSVTGTTGISGVFNDQVTENISRTYQIMKKNKMLIGFGISGPEDIKRFSPHCDGVIVGSAVVKSLMADKGLSNTISLIRNLNMACDFDMG